MAETIKKLTETDDIAGKAEKIILGLKNDRLLGGTNGLTTNQIRKFLTAVNTLTNKITLYRHQQEQTRALSEDLAKEVRGGYAAEGVHRHGRHGSQRVHGVRTVH